MQIKPITEKEKRIYNTHITHPLQSYEWGEFRQAAGIKVIRQGFYNEKDELIDVFQVTIHKVPHTRYTIGYLPKGNVPTPAVLQELIKIGKSENCIFIQLEPDITIENGKEKIEELQKNKNWNLKPSYHSLFTKYTFQLNLIPSEDQLLKNFHSKTRYNIKIAQKHGVKIINDNSDDAFEIYWKLMQETTQRQNFYAHTKKYHQTMFDTLQPKNQNQNDKTSLIAHLFLAKYIPETSSEGQKTQSPITLAAWILFTLHNTLYYPYGASSSEYRNVMASNLMMWEAILFGKKMGLKTFDMWGSLGENPDLQDPWYGFHRLKQGYNPKLVEFIGSYDLIINPSLYQLYKTANNIRWLFLKIKK